MKKDIKELDLRQLLDLLTKARIFEGLPGQGDLARALELEIQARKKELGLDDLIGCYRVFQNSSAQYLVKVDSIEIKPNGEMIPEGKFYAMIKAKHNSFPEECPRYAIIGETRFGVDNKYKVNLDLENKKLVFISSNINDQLEMNPVSDDEYNSPLDTMRQVFIDFDKSTIDEELV